MINDEFLSVEIVTAQVKPKPQVSQIRLGLELGNAPVSTTPHKLYTNNKPYGWKLIQSVFL